MAKIERNDDGTVTVKVPVGTEEYDTSDSVLYAVETITKEEARDLGISGKAKDKKDDD